MNNNSPEPQKPSFTPPTPVTPPVSAKPPAVTLPVTQDIDHSVHPVRVPHYHGGSGASYIILFLVVVIFGGLFYYLQKQQSVLTQKIQESQMELNGLRPLIEKRISEFNNNLDSLRSNDSMSIEEKLETITQLYRQQNEQLHHVQKDLARLKGEPEPTAPVDPTLPQPTFGTTDKGTSSTAPVVLPPLSDREEILTPTEK